MLRILSGNGEECTATARRLPRQAQAVRLFTHDVLQRPCHCLPLSCRASPRQPSSLTAPSPGQACPRLRHSSRSVNKLPRLRNRPTLTLAHTQPPARGLQLLASTTTIMSTRLPPLRGTYSIRHLCVRTQTYSASVNPRS